MVISNYDAFVTVRPEAEILLGLQRTGRYVITVMTFGNTEYAERFRQAGMRVIDFHPLKKFSFRYVRFIRQELIDGQYHILQLFNNKAMVNGIQAARNLPVKVVVYRGYTGNISWLDPSMYIKYLNPRVDRIICLVEAIRQLFRQNLFFNKNKAVTINKGHDISWYEGVAPISRESLGIPDTAFVFVCVANSRRMKGIKYMLQATHLFPPDAPLHLVLVGKDMDLPRFRRLIHESPIRERIHVLGFRKEILSIVKASNVFVLSSITGEAITKAVIEAMSLGVCPLITDIPGNKGLVIDGTCGRVVPPKDPKAMAGAMISLSKDPALCQHWGDAAREHIRKNFNIETTIRRYDELYRELLEEFQQEAQPS